MCYHKILCPNNDLSLNLKPDILYTQSVDLVLQQKIVMATKNGTEQIHSYHSL